MSVFLKKIALSLFIYSMGTSLSLSASFNCSNVTASVEVAICGNEQLSSLDEALSIEYRKAIKQNKNIKKIQQDWIRGQRKDCDLQVGCLIDAYQDQLRFLKNSNDNKDTIDTVSIALPISKSIEKKPPNTAVELHEPRLSDDNPIPILFNTTEIRNSYLILNESYWTNPQGEIFGKQIVKLTDDDFSYIEYRLKKEIESSLESTKSFYLNRKITTDPENDSVHQQLIYDLNRFISNIPKFKYWIKITNAKIKEQDDLQQQALIADNQRRAERDKELYAEKLDAKKKALAQSEQKKANSIKLMAFISIAAIVAFMVWNKFIRLRCPRCRSLNHVNYNVTELERFKGHVKVQEKNSKGVNTRAVSATLTINRYDYRCDDCGHQWSLKKKEELGANL